MSMEPWLLMGIVGGVVGGIVGGIGGPLLFVLLKKRRMCPECGYVFPVICPPSKSSQFWNGNRTCTDCGCEVDAKNRKVRDTNP